jgi:uncharacterized membrane protein
MAKWHMLVVVVDVAVNSHTTNTTIGARPPLFESFDEAVLFYVPWEKLWVL